MQEQGFNNFGIEREKNNPELKNIKKDLEFVRAAYQKDSLNGKMDGKTYTFEKDGEVIKIENNPFILGSINNPEYDEQLKQLYRESNELKDECMSLLENGYSLKKVEYHPGSSWENGKKTDEWDYLSVDTDIDIDKYREIKS